MNFNIADISEIVTAHFTLWQWLILCIFTIVPHIVKYFYKKRQNRQALLYEITNILIEFHNEYAKQSRNSKLCLALVARETLWDNPLEKIRHVIDKSDISISKKNRLRVIASDYRNNTKIISNLVGKNVCTSWNTLNNALKVEIHTLYNFPLF